MTTATTAYSYVRFSGKQQADGDSEHRQTERAIEYARRNGLALDTTLNLNDLGVSAFRGKNALNGNLGVFLNAVKTGRVKPGSILIVESFDRISRQGIDEGYEIIKGILKAGVRIATLSPERLFDREATRSLTRGALEIQMILERACEESERKSDRCTAAWRTKQSNSGRKAVTRKLPGWIRAVGGEGKQLKHLADDAVRLELVPEHAATVQRIFRLAKMIGMFRIARQFNAENVPLIIAPKAKRKPACWSTTQIDNILASPSTYGEYQPHRGRGKERAPFGKPIADYFPAAISRDEFHAVQKAVQLRKLCRGRRGNQEYLFSGLLRDWRDGGTICYKQHERRWGTSLIPVGAMNAKPGRAISFPAQPFEAAIIEELAEIKPGDVADDAAPSRLDAIDGRLVEIDRLIASWTAKMDNPNLIDVVAAKLADLGAARKQLTAERAEAERDAATPVGAAWGEFRTLAELLRKDASDELRLRIRAALRRAIERIDCLFLPAIGRDRLAIVKVVFRTGTVRTYFIHFTPPLVVRDQRTPGRWYCRSMPLRGFELGGRILRADIQPPDAFVARFRDYVMGRGCSTAEIP